MKQCYKLARIGVYVDRRTFGEVDGSPVTLRVLRDVL
jgi:hypothetical protein